MPIGGVAAVVLSAMSLTACNMIGQRAEISNETKFSQAEYKVAASPRVTVAKHVRRGGGYYMVGKPYEVKGKWYRPREDPGYTVTGLASWYGPNFHGRKTANGEIFDQYALSAAHPTMPLPSYARVTNLENGSSLIVRVNDRGPFAHNRVIDLSARAAKMLGYTKKGVARVRVQYVGRAPIDGHDEKFLLASYRAPGMPVPGATQPGTLLAMAGDSGPKRTMPDQPLPLQTVSGVAVSNQSRSDQGSLENRIEVALAGEIPIPEDRPVTYDGLPLDIASDRPLLAAAVPLGYRDEDMASRRISQAFSAFDRTAEVEQPAATGHTGDASQTAFIDLGTFDDASHAEYVRRRFADLGMISVRRIFGGDRLAWRVRLIAGGDVADQLVEIAHERGLVQAARIAD